MTVGYRAPDSVGSPDANASVQILMQDTMDARGQQSIYTKARGSVIDLIRDAVVNEANRQIRGIIRKLVTRVPMLR